MKSTLSVVILAGLIGLLMVACATSSGPRQLDAYLSGSGPSISNWSRVGQLSPAAEISVTLKGSRPGSRYFVTVDESALIVLNLTDPTLPGASTRVLRNMASRHPDYFAAIGRFLGHYWSSHEAEDIVYRAP